MAVSEKTILIHTSQPEFGWLLMFSARARYKARQYERVIVSCETSMTYLFEDFATEFITFETKEGWRDRFFFRGKRIKMPRRLKQQYPDVKYFVPTEGHCLGKEAEYVKLGEKIDSKYFDIKYDIVIHARNIKRGDWIDRACGGDHNWKKWNKFAACFKDRSIACIGSKKGSRHVEDAEDYRGSPLQDLCNLIANAKVVVGESSFPCHLASWCGTPHVVITHGRKEKSLGGKTNAWRYRKGWNCFKTPCAIIEHKRWNPPVEDVVKAVKKFL